MENTPTAAELKRRGPAAIENGLKRGPIHLMKRNKAAAVVVSESEYRRLVAAGKPRLRGMTAMQWLLANPSAGRKTRRLIDRHGRRERDG
ncbi:MAG: hypothetical protein ACREPL_05815 [Rhodanobacteraceae bacterium]